MSTTAGRNIVTEYATMPPEAGTSGNGAASVTMGPRAEPEWLPVARPVEALVEDISLVADGGRILIFCGEAHPKIYGDARFLKAARDARWMKGAQIEIITGPILLVSDKPGEGNGVLTLWQEEVVTALYHRRARYASSHFRVVETDLKNQAAFRYYAEAPHSPLLPLKDRRCENLSRLHPADVHQRALEARKRFDAWKEQATPHGAEGNANLPYVTTIAGLRKLMREASEQDLVFKYLDDEQMMQLLPSAPEVLVPYPTYRQALANGVSSGHR